MVTTIKKVDWGVANTYSVGDDYVIEINEHLFEPEFDDLRSRIINHEREHVKAKGFWKNRKVDALTELKFSHLFKFYKKYPKNLFNKTFQLIILKKKHIIY